MPLRLVLHSGFYNFEVFAHCFCHLLQSLRVGSPKPEASGSQTQQPCLCWLLNWLGHGHGLACSPHTHELFSYVRAVNCLLFRSRHPNKSILQKERLKMGGKS